MSDRAIPTVMLRRARPTDREAIERLLGGAGLPLAGVAEHMGEFLVAITAGAAWARC